MSTARSRRRHKGSIRVNESIHATIIISFYWDTPEESLMGPYKKLRYSIAANRVFDWYSYLQVAYLFKQYN